MALERTLLILKPDCVGRGLMGEILARFEKKGFRIVGMKMMRITRKLAQIHYGEHKGKPFYPGLLQFITAGPVVPLVVEGRNAVAVCRKMMGATFGPDADPGTIRGDYGVSNRANLIHGSDSIASARREIKLYFKPSELMKIQEDQPWVYDYNDGKPL